LNPQMEEFGERDKKLPALTFWYLYQLAQHKLKIPQQ